MPAQPSAPEHAPAETTHSIPRWALHRRLYEWVLTLAHSRHANWALFLLSFSESSFFPVPPDVLQIALTLERPRRAWWYASLSTVASVLGGIAGYIIGAGFWQATDQFFFRYVPGFTPEVFAHVQQLYEEWNFVVIFAAAFTPIPYKVFTITAGVFGILFPVFVLASIVGRAGRFFLVAALLWWFGPAVRRFVERYFNLLTVAFLILFVAGVAILKYLR
jgi:membrane protein YqaA with SNARE-associated domain